MNKIFLILLLASCTYNYPCSDKPLPSPSISPSPSMSPSPSPTPSVTPKPSPTSDSKAFKIGVWFQPISSFQKWKDRGVNVLFGAELEGYRKEEEWMQKAQDFGFLVIADMKWKNGPNPSAMFKEYPNVYSYLMPDEFDCKTIDGQGWPLDQVRPYYDAIKKAHPNAKTFCSFCGSNINYASKMQKYKDYMQFCDQVSQDWYPKSRNAERYPISLIGDAVNALFQWRTNNQEVWSIVEVANQGLPNSPLARDVTPKEFRASLWTSISKGATAIAYFPDYFNPATGGWLGFDNTPQTIEAEMKTFRKEIDEKWPLIQSGKLKVSVDSNNEVIFQNQ